MAISAGVQGDMGMVAGYSLMKAGVTNISNGLEEGRIDLKGMAQVLLGSTIACLSGRSMYYNFKGLLSAGDNLARSSRISETASETMESGKGCKGSTNAAEPPSAYGKGHDIETNGFGPDTGINRNVNYGLKAADSSYGVSNKPIGDYQLGTNTPSRNYVTGTSRTGMATGAEENICLKAGNGTGVSGTPGRKVPGSLGSTGLDVGKPKMPDIPEIWGKGAKSVSNTYTVDPSMQAKDIEMGVLVDGKYIKNPTAQNMLELIKPDSNYVGNSRMNGQFMYVVDNSGNIIIGSRAGQHMPHPTLIGGKNPTVQGAGIIEIRGGGKSIVLIMLVDISNQIVAV